MKVDIELKGTPDTEEYQAGLDLKKIFERDISVNSEGKIVIITGATLFGQATKDIDIIVYGELIKFPLVIELTSNENTEKPFPVFIDSFCFCIETKLQPPRDVMLDGLVMKVKYREKYSDVTNQSEKQKYALKNYIMNAKDKWSPYICNFIWLRSVSLESLKNLIGLNPNLQTRHNYLPSDFSLRDLFKLASLQNKPLKLQGKNYYGFYSGSSRSNQYTLNITEALKLFTEVRKTMGELTRKKLEKVTKRLIREQNYADAIGDKLLIISGRAGTGKTLKLLSIAYDLATQKGYRCLILTYNRALVSDIKRLLCFTTIPDSVDSHTVNITTLHQFIYDISIGFELGEKAKNNKYYIPDFIDKYQSILTELSEMIKQGAIKNDDIQEMMKSHHEEVAWDFILIDEAQDWLPMEKDLIFQIFGSSRIIIADGMDQMVRSKVRCNWQLNTPNHKTWDKKCLRQKSNLVRFVNRYAEEFDLGWELESIKESEGGKIIISSTTTPYSVFRNEFNNCKSSGNVAYDMLFLAPPNLVGRDGVDEYGNLIRCFMLTKDFDLNGFSLWDGTRSDLRIIYPTELNKHRIVQYDSCRGLEGWTVVCLQLDEFIRYKMETYEEFDEEGLLFQDDKVSRKNRFVYKWSLIPLTRAIDTVIITLKNPNSQYALRLKELAKTMEDFVEWV